MHSKRTCIRQSSCVAQLFESHTAAAVASDAAAAPHAGPVLAAVVSALVSLPWLRATVGGVCSATMCNNSVPEPTNQIVVTTRSRSVASANVECGECQNVKEC